MSQVTTLEVLPVLRDDKKTKRILIGSLTALLACGTVTGWPLYSQGHESTDDVQIDGHPNLVSALISGISNFARNLGGAIGVSFLVSYLARHPQISCVALVSHLRHVNVFFDRLLGALQQSNIRAGSSAYGAGQRSLAQIQPPVDAQANVLAFISAFFMLGMIVALPIPLPFLMKRPSAEALAVSQGMH
jgi:hypothetical protein